MTSEQKDELLQLVTVWVYTERTATVLFTLAASMNPIAEQKAAKARRAFVKYLNDLPTEDLTP